MKSKIITNSKRKVAILIVVLLLTCTAIYLLNSIKTNQIIVASKNNERNTKKIYTSDFSTSEDEGERTYLKDSVSIYPSTTTVNGETITTYPKDTIRKVTLEKYNDEEKNWEIYKGNNNEEYSYMLGDVNGDNKVNEYDAALIWGYKAGEIQFNEIQKRTADVNGDGNIDYNDYLTILYMDGTYYKVGEGTFEGCLSKYLVGNPYFENDMVISDKDVLNDSDIYKELVFNLSDEEIEEVKNNPITTTKASDARTVLRLKQLGYYNNDGESKEETLLRKMLADYDMNYKIDDGDERYYLKTAARLDNSLEGYITRQKEILEKIEDKTYYDTSIVKINENISLFPEIYEDGKYKVVVTNLKTSEISKEVQSKKPNKSEYDMSNSLEIMRYIINVSYYALEGLMKIGLGTFGIAQEYYFDIDTTAPICDSISYSETNPTNKDVNVTLKFTEPVSTAGEAEYSNEKILTYSNNTESSVTFYDRAGNSVTVPIRINNIDKSLPVLKDVYAERVNEDDYAKIVVTATFDKEISNVGGLRFIMMFGGIMGDGSDEKIIKGNQVIYTYYISPTDGGKVEITLSGNVIDLAGNKSDNINQVVKNDFNEFYPTAIKKGKYYYEFIKTRDDISHTIYTSENNYFKKGDKITVMKTSVSKYRFFNNEPEAEYNYTIGENDQEFADNTHMTYMEFNSNTVKFYDDNIKIGLDYINIKDVNIYFDTKAPTVTVKVRTETANEKNVYTQGTILKISAVASENIYNILNMKNLWTTEKIIPQVNILFSNSGLGKYNYPTDSTKGNAKFVDETTVDGKTVWNYIYEIQSSDDGNISIDYANDDTVIYDMAENKTTLVGAPKDITTGDININGVKIDNNNTVSYEIYKNNNKLTKFERWR